MQIGFVVQKEGAMKTSPINGDHAGAGDEHRKPGKFQAICVFHIFSPIQRQQ
jgi:hypothetical protein